MKKSFEPNGCTMWPDGNYKHCCDAHDVAWHVGRTFMDKVSSDIDLLWCVATNSDIWNAMIMFIGVSTAGLFVWANKRRKDR